MRTIDTSHVNESIAKELQLSPEERISSIRSPRWIGYPRAKNVLDKLEDLLSHPKTHRMPNLLLVGDTNNGKTMIVQRFCHIHEPHDNPKEEEIYIPVLDIQAPPVPSESRFYNSILDRLFAPYKKSDRVDRKLAQVLKLLRFIDVKMLIIDEIHHLLAGPMNTQRSFLNVIKYLGNELQIPIVAVGTFDAFRALQTDPQLSNRFEPVVLKKWTLDKDFLRLLISFERMIPLKNPSELHNLEIAKQIFSMSEGYIGEISQIIQRAAVLAIQKGSEIISPSILKSIDWVPPSKRKFQFDG